MGFKLFEDRIAVIADADEDVTKGGIILPPDSSGREQMRYGTVAVVGVGHRADSGELVPIDVNVGARVFWSRHSGSQITIDEQEYIFLASREVVGVVE